jgi:hypothetical protein
MPYGHVRRSVKTKVAFDIKGVRVNKFGDSTFSISLENEHFFNGQNARFSEAMIPLRGPQWSLNSCGAETLSVLAERLTSLVTDSLLHRWGSFVDTHNAEMVLQRVRDSRARDCLPEMQTALDDVAAALYQYDLSARFDSYLDVGLVVAIQGMGGESLI